MRGVGGGEEVTVGVGDLLGLTVALALAGTAGAASLAATAFTASSAEA